MQIFLDSGDLATLKKVLETYPIDGVTTNPTILARDLLDKLRFTAELKLLRGFCNDKLVFVQATSDDVDGMIADAKEIIKCVGGNVSIKLPAVKNGYTAAMKLASKGISVTMTAVYTTSQAMLAAKCGADFVAPYISHLDNLSLDGPQVAIDMSNMLKLHSFKTTVLAASFRTAAQVERVIAGGVSAVTVTADMLDILAAHPGTQREVEAFRENWGKRFSMNIGDLLVNDNTD